MNNSQYLYATLPRRLKASIVDAVVLLILLLVNPLILGMLSDNAVLKPIVMFGPVFLLEPFLVSFLGFTAGQYIFGIEVVRIDSHSKCPIVASFVRTYAKYLLGVISLFYMLFGNKYQAIHDHLVDTIVILSKNKVKKSPQFAQYGKRERVSDETFTYPSPMRRFTFLFVWYIPVSFVLGVIIGLVQGLVVPGSSGTSKLPEFLEIGIDIFFSLFFFGFAVLAAKGHLPGAKRKKKVLIDTT